LEKVNDNPGRGVNKTKNTEANRTLGNVQLHLVQDQQDKQDQ